MEHGGDIYGNQNIELDLSVNLSPIGPPEAVRGVLQGDDMKRVLTSYPDPHYRELKGALSQKLSVSKEWILCGNGASELLMAIVQAVRPERALIPVPTYQGYERALDAVGAEILYYELNKPQCAKFNPDKIYSDMPEAEIPNYPTGFGEITMNGLYDFEYKQNMLDKWEY